MPEERKAGKPARVKDEHHTHNEVADGLSENMQGFYNELSLIFPEMRMTSGRRDQSPSGGFSHHHSGDAVDIGKEHTDVFEYLNNTKEGLGLMNRYGLGILDETDPRNMKKTSATGPHFHIGKDSGLHEGTKKRFDQFDQIQPMQSFYSQNQNFDYEDTDNLKEANLNLYGNYNPETKVNLDKKGLGADPGGATEFNLVLPNQQIANTFISEIELEQEKESIKEENTEASGDRKLLEKKQMEEEQRINSVFEAMDKIHKRDIESSRRKPSTIKQQAPIPLPSIDIQTELPTLPSLFKV